MALNSRHQIATHFHRIFLLTTESRFLAASSPEHVIRTCATRINYSFIPSADSLCCPTRYISIGGRGPSSSRTQRGGICSPPDRLRVGWTTKKSSSCRTRFLWCIAGFPKLSPRSQRLYRASLARRCAEERTEDPRRYCGVTELWMSLLLNCSSHPNMDWKHEEVVDSSYGGWCISFECPRLSAFRNETTSEWPRGQRLC
jgi:hypothetical protein